MVLGRIGNGMLTTLVSQEADGFILGFRYCSNGVARVDANRFPARTRKEASSSWRSQGKRYLHEAGRRYLAWGCSPILAQFAHQSRVELVTVNVVSMDDCSLVMCCGLSVVQWIVSLPRSVWAAILFSTGRGKASSEVRCVQSRVCQRAIRTGGRCVSPFRMRSFSN